MAELAGIRPWVTPCSGHGFSKPPVRPLRHLSRGSADLAYPGKGAARPDFRPPAGGGGGPFFWEQRGRGRHGKRLHTIATVRGCVAHGGVGVTPETFPAGAEAPAVQRNERCFAVPVRPAGKHTRSPPATCLCGKVAGAPATRFSFSDVLIRWGHCRARLSSGHAGVQAEVIRQIVTSNRSSRRSTFVQSGAGTVP